MQHGLRAHPQALRQPTVLPLGSVCAQPVSRTPDDRPRDRTSKPAALWIFEEAASIRHKLIQRAGRLTRPHGRLRLSLSGDEITLSIICVIVLHYGYPYCAVPFNKKAWQRSTLPPSRGSTIGEAGLNFRVRDRNGWFPCGNPFCKQQPRLRGWRSTHGNAFSSRMFSPTLSYLRFQG